MVSQKIRNNASISYFFLGWLFLLAKNNPNFSDPFIKQHAKMATKGHFFFFISYFLYSYFLSSLFAYSIPFVQITIDHCIQIAFFSFLTLFIIHGVYKGQKEEINENGEWNSAGLFSLSENLFRLEWISEGQRITYLLSYVPFLGMIVAKRHPNAITESGARVSSVFGLFYILVFANRGFDSLSMILLFIGVLFLVYLGACFFIKDAYQIPRLFEQIPKMTHIYDVLQALPFYILDIFRMIFGKQEVLSFREHLGNTQKKNERFRTSLEEYFTDTSIAFSPFWIFVPFCNIIFIPKLFLSRQSRYVLAIGQGLVITLLSAIVWYFYGFTSPFELLFLFPAFYGIASLETNVFVRIPLIYEIYALLNTFTFGILNNTNRMKAIQKQDMSVSYKV